MKALLFGGLKYKGVAIVALGAAPIFQMRMLFDYKGIQSRICEKFCLE